MYGHFSSNQKDPSALLNNLPKYRLFIKIISHIGLKLQSTQNCKLCMATIAQIHLTVNVSNFTPATRPNWSSFAGKKCTFNSWFSASSCTRSVSILLCLLARQSLPMCIGPSVDWRAFSTRRISAVSNSFSAAIADYYRLKRALMRGFFSALSFK